MARIFLLVLLTSSLAAPAFGKELKCRAADESNRNRKDVKVTTVSGAQIVTPKVTPYRLYNITVTHQIGDKFEKQTLLTLTAGGASAQTYNVSEEGIYQLHLKGLFLQCGFE